MNKMKKIVMLQNGSREEAYKKFEEVKNGIIDFTKESVNIKARNLRNIKEGWSVTKILF